MMMMTMVKMLCLQWNVYLQNNYHHLCQFSMCQQTLLWRLLKNQIRYEIFIYGFFICPSFGNHFCIWFIHHIISSYRDSHHISKCVQHMRRNTCVCVYARVSVFKLFCIINYRFLDFHVKIDWKCEMMTAKSFKSFDNLIRRHSRFLVLSIGRNISMSRWNEWLSMPKFKSPFVSLPFVMPKQWYYFCDGALFCV